MKPRKFCWNSRGARSLEFNRSLNEMISLYKNDFIAILELKISGEAVDEVCKSMGKSAWIQVKAKGFSGGILVLWNGEEIRLKVQHAHQQFIHTSISSYADHTWLLAISYANPNACVK